MTRKRDCCRVQLSGTCFNLPAWFPRQARQEALVCILGATSASLARSAASGASAGNYDPRRKLLQVRKLRGDERV